MVPPCVKHGSVSSNHHVLPQLSSSSSSGKSTVTSNIRYLGRMSWDKGFLDAQSTDHREWLSPSPKKTITNTPLPQAPVVTSPTKSSLHIDNHKLRSSVLSVGVALNSKNHRSMLTYSESMDEVEKMLNERMHHRLSPNKLQIDKTTKLLSTVEQTVQRRDPTQARSVFKPLQDPLFLLAAATQRIEDDEMIADTSRQSDEIEGSGNGNDNDLDTASLRTKQKYFGPAAKRAYYKTYQELHGKPHLFVENVLSTPIRSSLRSSSSMSSIDDHSSSKHRSRGSIPTSSSSPDLPGSPTNDSDLSRIPTSLYARRRLAVQVPAITPLTSSSSGSSSIGVLSTQSPRVMFLSSCITHSHPALSLLIRKENCHTFDFSHQGLGDAFIIHFAACLPDLPLVEAINVCDNRLSDDALNALLLALENKPNLTKLDISENEVGRKSVKSLRRYISSSLCTLKTLILNDADVDDTECTLFMVAFEQNKSVEHLFLRSNRIGQLSNTTKIKKKSSGNGSNEQQALTTPPTGGEAIGAMLNVNLNILELDLSWNLLRFTSSAPIANSLQLNYNLRELNLSYNGCGDQGGMVFGQALRNNSTLQKLNLSYNNIGPKGAMVIASGLTINKGLQVLILDGNSLGLECGRALMHASCLRQAGKGTHSVCHMSLHECNLTSTTAGARTSKELLYFNPADPTGTYSLDLTDPYDSMIAHELLRLATYKPGYRFAGLEHRTSTASGQTAVNIELSHPSPTQTVKKPKLQRKVSLSSQIDGQEVGVSTKNCITKSPIALLFAQIDKDHSGSVDHEELVQTMHDYGITVGVDDMWRMLSEYDYDQSGTLQEDEFQDFFFRCGFAMIDTDHSGSLNQQEIEKVLRLMGIHDINEDDIKRMMTQYDLDNSGEIDESEFLEFMKNEILHQEEILLDDTEERESDCKTGDDAVENDTVSLRDSAGEIWKIPTTGTLDVEFVFECDDNANSNPKDSLSRRQSIITNTIQNRIVSNAVVAKLLSNVQTISPNTMEQVEFLKVLLETSDLCFTAPQAEDLLIKQGVLKTWRRKLHALVRILPQMVNRREAANLVARVINDPEKQWRERIMLRKQLGNWYPILLGSLTNKYRFDLRSVDDRSALKQLALLAHEEKQFSKNRSGRQDTSQSGNWENFRSATVDNKSFLLTSTYILNTLLAPTAPSSSSLSVAGVGRDKKDVIVEFYYVSTSRPPRGTNCLSQRRLQQLMHVLTQSVEETNIYDYAVGHECEQITVQRENALLRWEILRNHVRSMRKEKTRHDVQSQLPLAGLEQVKATLSTVQQKLMLLEILVSDRWLSSQQAIKLIQTLPNVFRARAKAACLLFSRIVDLENFIHVYDDLSIEDQVECIKRLGWLNIFDPMKPDRQYPPMDLSIRDERELVQILAQLAVHEGKQTWQNASYLSGRATGSVTHTVTTDLPLAGWGNPDATGDESLKRHGIVHLKYVSNVPSHDRPNLRSKVLCGTRLFL